ncbi:MAG TPA: GNAT family N-acetyltransferase [Oligoflexus sp.]|uniref:GNAT family N-acetyltransferase n=1 Tax=Oligoflexus sp. TaxID=1971216 RepID=UPI002D2BEC58|nr:GNAT family N-acetyltransferase [Oligoflexus sp.]HYX37695.1 GNAT family N-acetyltransferase [Oligoflexus sp.]
MHIETQRLILRPWTLDDAPHYEAMSKDIGYNCFASPGYYLARDQTDLVAKIQQRMTTFAQHGICKFPIFRKDDGAFVGTCGADFFDFQGQQEIEMGYRLMLAHWGMGYATEAATAMLQYLFQKIEARSVFGFAVAQNPASIKVLEKIGFRYRQPIDYADVQHQLYEAQGKFAFARNNQS